MKMNKVTAMVIISAFIALVSVLLVMRLDYLSGVQEVQVNMLDQEEREEKETNELDDIDNRPLKGIEGAEFSSLTPENEVVARGVTILSLSGKIENPSTGDEQQVWLSIPKTVTELPLVIMLAGGEGNGAGFALPGKGGLSQLEELAGEGFITVAFSALGVGGSEGVQNFYGHDDQDGIAAIVSAAMKLDGVDTDRVGFASFSYGVTGATGVLARYPELGIKFFSDWEGPSSRSYTTVGCTNDSPAQKQTTSPASFDCDDDSHWAQRESSEFMKEIEGLEYYWRLQAQDDHVQDTYEHTIEMLQSARKAEIPWFRVNEGEANTVYGQENMPVFSNRDDKYTDHVYPNLVWMAQQL